MMYIIKFPFVLCQCHCVPVCISCLHWLWNTLVGEKETHRYGGARQPYTTLSLARSRDDAASGSGIGMRRVESRTPNQKPKLKLKLRLCDWGPVESISKSFVSRRPKQADTRGSSFTTIFSGHGVTHIAWSRSNRLCQV